MRNDEAETIAQLANETLEVVRKAEACTAANGIIRSYFGTDHQLQNMSAYILDLTAELELHPSVRPSQLDEAAANQKQLPMQTQVTGSSKRTPEPTREEIIAAPAGSAEDILDLTAELELHPSVRPSQLDEAAANQKQLPMQTQVTGSSKRTPEPTREEIIAAPAGSAEDILDLTAELELHPSVRPSQLDEAAANQKQLPTQTQVTGSSKRTPEPTREEIIAAMRRIISDD